MDATRLKALWPAGLALGAALALALLVPSTPARRVTNLDLSASGFPDTYVMFSKSEADRVYLTNRRDSTLRRDDSRVPGRMWWLDRIPGPGAGPETLLVRSKRKGKGSVFFVPVERVRDWSYPFLYEFVAERHPELELPYAGWTPLFVDRVYRGLHLRIDLPFDLRKKDGGSGVLRELLSVRGGRLAALDTRFDDAPGVYVEALASGSLPGLSPPPPWLVWLARRAPTETTTFLLSNSSPPELFLLPLPVALPPLFESLHGRPPTSFEDARYARWTGALDAATSEDLDAEDRAELASAFAAYASNLRAALLAHGTLHESLRALRADLGGRQAALSDLSLSLGEI